MKKSNTCYRHRPEIVKKRERDDFDYDRIEKVKDKVKKDDSDKEGDD